MPPVAVHGPAAFAPRVEALESGGAPLDACWAPLPLPYPAALEAMDAVQRQRCDGTVGDLALYLEHEAVVTYGRATPPGHLGWASQGSTPSVSVPRGGLATYHGPGQLVGYLFLNLKRRADGRGADLHDYLRALELGIIAFLGAVYDLPAVLRANHTGVWTHGFPGVEDAPEKPAPALAELPRKIAAIGISCRRWVTAHGVALNIDPDMTAFKRIVPCGITDAESTSVAREHELAGRPFVPEPMKELAAALHLNLLCSLQAAGWCLPDGNSEG